MSKIQVPTPARLASRPTFRGMPIPFTVYVGEDGVPDFRVIDPRRIDACVERGLCVLCGQRLGRRQVFVGGPSSIEHGLFGDGPMHEECARYAVATCPYLTGAHAQHADPAVVEQKHEGEAVTIKTDSAVAAGRPERMGLYFTFSSTWRSGRFHAGPAIRVEWF